jgi:hypothetical protein
MKPLFLAFAVPFALVMSACSATGTPVREPAFIGETELSAMLTAPPNISLRISGDLPTACHAFHSEYEIQSGRIDVTVYSTISPAATCIQGLAPFDETIEIPMSGQPSGTYHVYLTGDLIGQIEFVSNGIE